MVAERFLLYAEIEYQVWDCRGRAGSFLLLAEDGGLGSRRRTVGFIPSACSTDYDACSSSSHHRSASCYDGTTNWFRYAGAVEEWCDLTKVEARRRGPAVAARLSGRAEIYKERLDRERLRDPETGVEYLLATLRPFFVKDLQSVFLYRFFQLLRCNGGQTDHQRWMIKYEIARQKAVDAWLEATTPSPAADHADVAAQIDRLRDASPRTTPT